MGIVKKYTQNKYGCQIFFIFSLEDSSVFVFIFYFKEREKAKYLCAKHCFRLQKNNIKYKKDKNQNEGKRNDKVWAEGEREVKRQFFVFDF